MATHHHITSSSHHVVTNMLRDLALPQLEVIFPELPPRLINAVVCVVTCIKDSPFVAPGTQRNQLAEAKKILDVTSTFELRNVVLTRIFLYLLIKRR